MKYILIMMIFPALISGQCANHKNSTSPLQEESPVKEEQFKDSIPSCVRQKIEDIKKEPKWNPAAQVDEYIYKDKHVFFFSADCCDQFNMLYSDSCNVLCAPSGGIAGQGDMKCVDFSKTAKYVKLVWKDPR
jgi:hypothetical protein